MGEYLEADKLPGLEIIPNAEPDLGPDRLPRPKPGAIDRLYHIDPARNFQQEHQDAMDEISEIPVG